MRKAAENWDELLNFQYRWPKKGDRLLRRSDNRDMGVDQPMTRHVHQWHGFMSAGAGLIELCTREGYEHERHFVIYPILFNYRHGLELAMKFIVVSYSGQDILGVEEDHDLWKLWKQCRMIFDQYESNDKDGADAVEQIIKDFHNLDKAGVTFRYGWGKGGKEIKLPDHTIDLENIRDVMEGVAGFFDGLDGWLADLNSAGS